MLTTYIAYQLMHRGLSYWVAFFATLAIAFVLGTVLQVTVIRPVQHRSVIATVIVTVGLFILIDGVVNWIWGGEFKSLPSPFGTASYDVGGVAIPHLYVGIVVVVFASAVLVWALFRFTKLGLAMRAAALRPAAASLVGVRVDAMLAIGWGLAAVLGAVAGLMAEPSQLFLRRPSCSRSSSTPSPPPSSAASRARSGAVVGGIVIGVFHDPDHRVRAARSAPSLELPFAFAVLLVILLVKPTGLFGRREVRRV